MDHAVMIFPAIFDATVSPWHALFGFIVAIIFAYHGTSMGYVALTACLSVFVMELFLY